MILLDWKRIVRVSTLSKNQWVLFYKNFYLEISRPFFLYKLNMQKYEHFFNFSAANMLPSFSQLPRYILQTLLNIVTHIVVSALGRLRQKDCHELETNSRLQCEMLAPTNKKTSVLFCHKGYLRSWGKCSVSNRLTPALGPEFELEGADPWTSKVASPA